MTCDIQPQAAMYGLGIRLAFYIQWFFASTFNYIDRDQLPELRLLGLTLSGSLVLSLVIQLGQDTLRPVETYIMITLSTGEQIFLVPMYVWCLLTCWDPYWSPFVWANEEQHWSVRTLKYVIALTGASVAMWFFTNLAHVDDGCKRFAFAFSKVSLQGTGFTVLNCMLYVGILVACGVMLAAEFGCIVDTKEISGRRLRKKRLQGELVVQFRFMSDMAVLSLMIAAIELTVTWNGLPSADGIGTTGGLFALLASIAVIIRVIAEYCHQPASESGSDAQEWPPYYQRTGEQTWPMSREEMLSRTRWSEGRRAYTV